MIINAICIEMNKIPIDIPTLESKVSTKMKILHKQSKFIEQEKVVPNMQILLLVMLA